MLARKTHQDILSMEQLVDTVQQLSLAKDMEEVMQIVRSTARALTGADGATFVLKDNDMCYYADEDAISPLWKGKRFPINSCISGWVMSNKQAATIEDIYNDERIPIDVYKSTFIKSLLIVPIRTIDPIGAIGNYWAKKHQPTPAEISALQALADITAVSIENIEIRNTLEQKVIERTQELTDSINREKELNLMKSAFVSMASHEFRTPLTSILSSASLIERYPELEQQENRVKHISKIKSNVKNLTDLLNDFLSLDKLQAGKMETHHELQDISLFMDEIKNELDGLIKIDQKINYRHKGSSMVSFDKKILQNVMLNLLSNAIKYSDKDVEIETELNDQFLKIKVQDQGIGIPQKEQEKLFNQFFRASNANNIQGTGLGLNIVQRYIELLNGSINYTSKENKGTTFNITLPVDNDFQQNVSL